MGNEQVTKSFHITKVIISLMGMLLVVQYLPNTVGTILYNREFSSTVLNMYDDSKFGMSLWYDGSITSEIFIVSTLLGLSLIIFRAYIAKFVVSVFDKSTSGASQRYENIMIIAFPLWMIVEALITLNLGYTDTTNEVAQLILGIILIISAYYFLIRRRK